MDALVCAIVHNARGCLAECAVRDVVGAAHLVPVLRPSTPADVVDAALRIFAQTHLF